MGRLLRILGFLALVLPVAYRFIPARAAEAASGKTVVRYMAWGYPSQLKTERELIDAFEALPENRDVDVEFVMAPMSSYYDKLQLMLASKTGPDVVRVNPDYFRAYLRLGYFRPLDDLMAGDPNYRLEDFWPSALRGLEYEGKRYGVGVLFTTTLVYYNRTVFRNAGVKDPWERYLEGRWAWEDFLDAARATTVRDGNGRAVLYGSGPIGNFYNIMNYVAGHGASIITPDARTSLVNCPAAVAATEWMNDLVWKWKVAPTPEQGALSVFSFESGRLAMEMDSSGESPRLRDAITKFEWDVAPGPAGPNGYRSGHNAHILVMASGTRVSEAAWRFMSFMVSPAAERLLGCRLRRCIPTRKAMALSDEYLSADRPPFNMRAFIARHRRFPARVALQREVGRVDPVLAGPPRPHMAVRRAGEGSA